MDKSIAILISGKKQHGKDTVAQFMKSYFDEHTGFMACVVHFSDAMKEAIQIIFGLDDEQLYGKNKEVVDKRWGMTPRHIMQQFGTEVVRQVDPDTWALSLALHYKLPGHVIIVPDCRFSNEITTVIEQFDYTYVLRVDRPLLPPTEFDNHISETELDNTYQPDEHIFNNGNLENLQADTNIVTDYIIAKIMKELQFKSITNTNEIPYG